MTVELAFQYLGLAVVASPAVLLAVLGLPMLCGIRLSEDAQGGLTKASVVIGLLAAVAILVLMLVFGSRHVPIELGNWVSICLLYTSPSPRD